MSSRIRKHFSNNVVGYIAILLILMTGSAYALKGKNTVFSDDIVNGQVKRPDIRANAVNSGKVQLESLQGIDVAGDTLTGFNIDEGSLDQVPDSAALGGKSLSELENTGDDTHVPTTCDPNSTANILCASRSFATPEGSDILVIATGGWFGIDNDGSDADGNDSDAGQCSLSHTGAFATDVQIGNPIRLGQDSGEHRVAAQASAFALTGVVSTAADNPTIKLRCNEQDSDIKFQDFSISVVRLSSP